MSKNKHHKDKAKTANEENWIMSNSKVHHLTETRKSCIDVSEHLDRETSGPETTQQGVRMYAGE